MFVELWMEVNVKALNSVTELDNEYGIVEVYVRVTVETYEKNAGHK